MMNAADVRPPSTSSHTYLLVPILLLFVLLVIAVLRAPNLISNVGIGSAIIVSAPLILATYALTIIAMAGRVGVDLSIGPLIGFINVSMIQLYAARVIETPVEFFAYAIAVGILYQLLMGLIIVFVRVQPIIVALSGYLALVGLNLVILPRPGGVAPDWMMPWGLGTSIWSPVLAILVLATLAWFLLTRLAFFGHLRLMGSDERMAYTAGVRINIVRLGAHVIAGVFSALAALTFTSLISSGDPTQGTTYTLMAVTALVLGGTSLAGGRGSVIGSLLGALNIYLITYVLSTFSFGMVQSFVTDAAYGVVLVLSLLLTLILPRLPDGVRRISPIAFFVILGVIAFGVILYSKEEVMAPPAVAESYGITVVGGDGGTSEGPGVTVLGAEPEGTSESGLTVLGGQSSGSGVTVLGGDTSESSGSGVTVLGGETETESGSGVTVLGAEPEGSGITVLGAEPGAAEETEPRGTPLVYAVIIIFVVGFLIYLLYRHASFALVTFIGVLILLVLGLSLYEGVGPRPLTVASGSTGYEFFVFQLEPTIRHAESVVGSVFLPQEAVFASPMIGLLLFAVGTVLISSLLIVIGHPKVRSRIGNTPLLFLLALGAVATVVIIYANQGVFVADSGLFSGALGLVLVGAVMFAVSLPRVQSRARDISIVLLAILGMTAVGAMYFAASPRVEPAVSAVPMGEIEGTEKASALPAVAFQFRPSETFQAALVCVVVAAIALFIATLPLVRQKIHAYVALEKGVKVFSYTGAFIVVYSILAIAAIFFAAGVPLWKLAIVIVAAAILWRYGWRFLRRYRGGNLLMLVRHEPRGQLAQRETLGARR